MHFFHSAFMGSPDKCLAPILSWHVVLWPALPCALLFVALALSTKPSVAITITVATVCETPFPHLDDELARPGSLEQGLGRTLEKRRFRPLPGL